jgi:hypothetical protein
LRQDFRGTGLRFLVTNVNVTGWGELC